MSSFQVAGTGAIGVAPGASTGAGSEQIVLQLFRRPGEGSGRDSPETGGTEGAAESKWDDGIELGDRTWSRGTHEAGIALRRGVSCVLVLGKGVSAGKWNVHTVNKEVD